MKIKLKDYLDKVRPSVLEEHDAMTYYAIDDRFLDQEIEIPEPPKKEFKPANGPYITGEHSGAFGGYCLEDKEGKAITGFIDDEDTARLLSASWEMWEFIKRIANAGFSYNEFIAELYPIDAQQIIDRLEGR
jgi:hypothetical protein